MLKKRLLIGIIILLAGGILFVFGMSLRRAFEPMAVKNPIVTRADGPDHFKEVAIKLPGPKGGYWDLRVEKTENQSGVGLLHRVKGKYVRGSKMMCRIAGDSGRVNWEQGILTVMGNVELVTAENKQVSADRVTWDPTPESITATGHVRFSEPKVMMNTEQLLTDINFMWVKTKGQTNTKLLPSGDE